MSILAHNVPQDKQSGNGPNQRLSPAQRAQLTQTAEAFLQSGVSLVPVGYNKLPLWPVLPEGDPDPKTGKSRRIWKPFQDRQPTPAELQRWLKDYRLLGIGCVGGTVSGGLLIIDFDIVRFYDSWKERVGALIDGLPHQRTGGGGYQVWLRCNHPGENQKLAWTPDETQDSGRSIAIETRGEGGYGLAPFSLHPSGNLYQPLAGDFFQIPLLDDATVATLIAEASALDEAPFSKQELKQQKNAPEWKPRQDGNPGVIATYNKANPIDKVLEDHGYTRIVNRYKRPNGGTGSVILIADETGKERWSYHYSSNDALDDRRKHDSFSVFCLLDHNGDVRAAVKDAARQLGLDRPAQGSQGSQQRTHGAAPSADEAPDERKTKDSRQETDRPMVIVNNRDLHEAANEALGYLVADHQKRPRLFVRGGLLCRVRHNEQGLPIIETLSLAMLKHALSLCTSFAREHQIRDSVFTTLVAPPDNIVKDILERGEWGGIPPLLGISETPPVNADGKICTQEGYDPQTQLYYAPTRLKVSPIPEAPSAEEIAEACAVIDDVICDFPFAEQGARANFYALLLTPVLRAAIDGVVPLALIEAPKMGNGKSLLADIVSIVATGREASTQAPPTDAEEWHKLLTSAFAEGAPIIALDNLDHELSSGVLSQALANPVWTDRLLGTNKRPLFQIRCTWMATGNNIRLAGDLPRRCYRIRIDAKVDKPWLREESRPFKHKHLRRYAKSQRFALVSALLILARAWYAAGQPEQASAKTLGSYEEWARVIGGILTHAGINGFLANREKLYDQADRTSFQWEAFLIALYHAYPGGAFSCKTIVHNIEANNEKGQAIKEALPEILADALQSITGKSFSTRLGMALSQRVDTRYGLAGWHITLWGKDSRGGTPLYRVFMGNEDEPEPEQGQTSEQDHNNVAADRERSADLADLADLKHPERAFFNSYVQQKNKKDIEGAERSARSARSAEQMQTAFKGGPAIVNQVGPPFDGTSARAPEWQEEWDALTESTKMHAIRMVKGRVALVSETPPAEPTIAQEVLEAKRAQILDWASRQRPPWSAYVWRDEIQLGGDGTEAAWRDDVAHRLPADHVLQLAKELPEDSTPSSEAQQPMQASRGIRPRILGLLEKLGHTEQIRDRSGVIGGNKEKWEQFIERAWQRQDFGSLQYIERELKRRLAQGKQ